MPKRKWTEDEAVLVATFGVCSVCGAPRNTKRTTLPNSETPYLKMICTADESHDNSE